LVIVMPDQWDAAPLRRVRSATTLACCGNIRRARSKVSVMGRCRGGSPEMIVLARYMLGLIAIAEAREA
jgi:hypothetical protein